MVTDRFASFQSGLSAPYTDAVALVASDAEFEPTAAIYVNIACDAVLQLSDSPAPVTFAFEVRGVYHFRVKKLVSVSVSGWGAVPVVIGLY